jgi:hypothetical protein
MISLRVLAVAAVLATAVAAAGCGAVCGHVARCTTACDTCSNATGRCVRPAHPPQHAVGRVCPSWNCTAGCNTTVWPSGKCFATPDGLWNKAFCHDPAPGKLTMYNYPPGDSACAGGNYDTQVLQLDRCLAGVGGDKYISLSCPTA